MSDFDPIVTLYPDGTDALPECDLPFSQVVQRIKSGQYRSRITAIRQRFQKTIDRGADREAAKKQVGGLKKRLQAFAASGVFSVRGEGYLKTHSGLIQADFDLLGDRMAEIREKLATDVHVFALFTSPTGEGLKAFYRCSPAVDKPEHLRRYFAVEKHCLEHYGVQIDESVKDMSRLCFVSDDPDAKLFPDAEEIQPIDPPVVAVAASQVTVNSPISRGPVPGSQQAYTNREDDPELVRSALKAIPAEERSLWLKMGASIKGTFGESGWSMFDEWSKASEKYEAEANRKTWDSLETVHCTVGSVFHTAKMNGWVFPRKERSDNEHQSESGPESQNVPQHSESFDQSTPAPTKVQNKERIICILEDRQFNILNVLPKPATRYWLGDTPICTAGNLTAISAAVKSGKTSALTAMMASAMSEAPAGHDFLGFKSRNEAGHAIVHIDTEQSVEDHDEMVRRALRRAGLVAVPDWFHSFCLTGITVKDMQDALWAAMETAFIVHRGIHSVLIDGVADMVADVNDPPTSNALVAELHGKAILYKCSIIGIIHFNPGTEKTRGHLGSQLERKAETNLRMEREGDTEAIVMWADKTRKAPILKRSAPRFAWSDEAGMHISVDFKPADSTGGGRPSTVDRIATMNSHSFVSACVQDGENLRVIMRRLEIWLAGEKIDASSATCQRAIQAMISNGKLAKGNDLLYRRGPNA